MTNIVKKEKPNKVFKVKSLPFDKSNQILSSVLPIALKEAQEIDKKRIEEIESLKYDVANLKALIKIKDYTLDTFNKLVDLQSRQLKELSQVKKKSKKSKKNRG